MRYQGARHGCFDPDDSWAVIVGMPPYIYELELFEEFSWGHLTCARSLLLQPYHGPLTRGAFCIALYL